MKSIVFWMLTLCSKGPWSATHQTRLPYIATRARAVALAPRTAHVVVGGTRSHDFTIENSVFQGTVLGPVLWNCFFMVPELALRYLFFVLSWLEDLIKFLETCRWIFNIF